MKSAAISLSNRRSQRFALWLLMLLTWLAAVTPANQRHARQRFPVLTPERLAKIERIIMRFVIARAGELTTLRPARPRHHDFGLHECPTGYRRILAGCRLRRAMKARNVRDRVARLVAVLANLELWALRMVRRLRSNLTRLGARKFKVFANAPCTLTALQPCAADSS